ncbi:uncharacterized protein LOC134280792 [Saccostrea cucullata]|uniref:uncharacterized protein LOC134280792 n=1 Tax=Saccostrea cuccullata TaxID=36930 RepID=UPI002ED5B813
MMHTILHYSLMFLLIFETQEYVHTWKIKIVKNDTTLSREPWIESSTPINSNEVTLIDTAAFNSTNSNTIKNASTFLQGEKEKSGKEVGVIIIFVVFGVLIIFLAIVVIIILRLKKKLTVLPSFSSLRNLCRKERTVVEREPENIPMNTTCISDV